MVLTQTQMEKKLETAPRKRAGEVNFDCPNCGKHLHRTIWGTATEIDEDGELTYDFFAAQAKCRCGAAILVAETDYEGGLERFWLNKKEMTANNGGVGSK